MSEVNNEALAVAVSSYCVGLLFHSIVALDFFSAVVEKDRICNPTDCGRY